MVSMQLLSVLVLVAVVLDLVAVASAVLFGCFPFGSGLALLLISA